MKKYRTKGPFCPRKVYSSQKIWDGRKKIGKKEWVKKKQSKIDLGGRNGWSRVYGKCEVIKWLEIQGWINYTT